MICRGWFAAPPTTYSSSARAAGGASVAKPVEKKSVSTSVSKEEAVEQPAKATEAVKPESPLLSSGNMEDALTQFFRTQVPCVCRHGCERGLKVKQLTR